MKNLLVKRPKFIIATLLLLAFAVFVRCTKTGAVASQLDRSVAASALDSTIFSPFYDSTVVPYANSPAGVNDIAITTGVLDIIKTNCATSDCHGGNVQPTLNSYASVKALVTPGNPAQSQLWQLLTTNNLNKAMPPVNTNNDLSLTEKNTIYNWIVNGANETPGLVDYRPAAVRLITTGCTSANCHSQYSAVGYWARNGWVSIGPADTIDVQIGTTLYPELTNQTVLNTIWQAYVDSVYTFYADTLNNASFRPWKYFQARGPLSTYQDLLMDINYPKAIRSSKGAYSVNGVVVNCKGDYLNGTSSLLTRIDSTMVMANPRTVANGSPSWGSVSSSGSMAYSDGGMGQADIPIIKAWYFLDPNIPNIWKFGPNNAGIFKYANTGIIITPQQ